MNTTNTATESTTLHIFERAGLGKAPFKFVGMVYQDIAYGEVVLNREEWNKTGIRMSTKSGGTCDYCGQYIVHMFNIVSADGRTFKVGSDCLEKTGSAGMKKVVAAHVKAQRQASAARAKEKLAARVKEEAATIDRAKLATLPHPNKWRADAGETALNWFEWMEAHAGDRTMGGILKQARALLGA